MLEWLQSADEGTAQLRLIHVPLHTESRVYAAMNARPSRLRFVSTTAIHSGVQTGGYAGLLQVSDRKASEALGAAAQFQMANAAKCIQQLAAMTACTKVGG